MPLLKSALPALCLVALGSAATAASLASTSGTYACTYRDFRQCTDGSAKVTLADGKLQAVVFVNNFCPVKRKPPGGCTVESERTGGPGKWADDARATRITFTDPKHPQLEDVFAVVVEDEHIVLDFSDTQPVTRCKDSGDLPERIVIDPRTAQCRVNF
jgi:hypothetical protein